MMATGVKSYNANIPFICSFHGIYSSTMFLSGH